MSAILSKNFHFPLVKIAEFCHKWKIKEFAVFGSVLRDDFNSNSDIDCLVKFCDSNDFVQKEDKIINRLFLPKILYLFVGVE